jgi:hypothetical protein
MHKQLQPSHKLLNSSIVLSPVAHLLRISSLPTAMRCTSIQVAVAVCEVQRTVQCTSNRSPRTKYYTPVVSFIPAAHLLRVAGLLTAMLCTSTQLAVAVCEVQQRCNAQATAAVTQSTKL